MEAHYLYLEISIPIFFQILLNRFQAKTENWLRSTGVKSTFTIEHHKADCAHVTTAYLPGNTNPFLSATFGIESFQTYKIYFDDFNINTNQDFSLRMSVADGFYNNFFRHLPDVVLTPVGRITISTATNISAESSRNIIKHFGNERFSYDFDHSNLTITLESDNATLPGVYYLRLNDVLFFQLFTIDEMERSDSLLAAKRQDKLTHRSLSHKQGPAPGSSIYIDDRNSPVPASPSQPTSSCVDKGPDQRPGGNKAATVRFAGYGGVSEHSVHKTVPTPAIVSKDNIAAAVEFKKWQEKLVSLGSELKSIGQNDEVGFQRVSAEIQNVITEMGEIMNKKLNSSLSVPPPTTDDCLLAPSMRKFLAENGLITLNPENPQHKIALRFFGRTLPPILRSYDSAAMEKLLDKMELRNSTYSAPEEFAILALNLLRQEARELVPAMLQQTSLSENILPHVENTGAGGSTMTPTVQETVGQVIPASPGGDEWRTPSKSPAGLDDSRLTDVDMNNECE